MILKNNFEKNKLLYHLVLQREEFSRGFFSGYQPFDLNGFLSYNLLIFRVTKEPYFNARKAINYDLETQRIVKGLKIIIQNKMAFLLFKQGLSEAIKENGKTKIIPNELYFSVLRTYEDNDIWEKTKAEEKMKEYRPIFESIISNQPSNPVAYSPEDFVKQFYSVINQFYCCFLRNEVYDEVFSLLKKYVEIDLTPGKLMDLVNSYPMIENKLGHTSLHEFISRAKTRLGVEEKKTREILLSYETSPNSFPLFPLINGRVYISHRTAFLIYILMHAIIYKDDFNRETENAVKSLSWMKLERSLRTLGGPTLQTKWTRSNQLLKLME